MMNRQSFGGMDLHILQKCTWQKVIIRKIIKNNKLTMCSNLSILTHFDLLFRPAENSKSATNLRKIWHIKEQKEKFT